VEYIPHRISLVETPTQRGHDHLPFVRGDAQESPPAVLCSWVVGVGRHPVVAARLVGIKWPNSDGAIFKVGCGGAYWDTKLSSAIPSWRRGLADHEAEVALIVFGDDDASLVQPGEDLVVHDLSQATWEIPWCFVFLHRHFCTPGWWVSWFTQLWRRDWPRLSRYEFDGEPV
jgi:hypothetical protein